MDILLSDENGLGDIQQGVGRLINAIVTVLGPELVPGSILFSRSKSAIAEISCWQETSTMLESARFTQQLVLFAPLAVSVHSHVQTLLSTLSSRQPNLRHLAVSTLRHLIEKDPASVIVEQIEDKLFFMLDEETDSEIGNLVRATIMRLLYASCPSCPLHWISVCRKVVLATSMRNIENNISTNDNTDGDGRLNHGDDENMVSSSNSKQTYKFQPSIGDANREKYLRYRTRLFAAECLSHLPEAVGRNPAHFDLLLARQARGSGKGTGDWLVLHLQELISLAYQISTIQFENMQPVGVGLLGTIVDKFEKLADPELPGHLLLEQYQAQLVSAVRTTLDTSSSPSLLEAGLHLATKILTSGIISGDQVVVKRIFSLISRPLNDFEDIYYPSFAEWVTSKIKIRLLAAHASLKCYIYASMRKHQDEVPDDYLALLPLFQKSSNILGKYWIHTLKDYSYICLCLTPKRKWNLFLDGLHSPIVSSKLRPCLDESWPVILQALALDAVPVNPEGNDSSKASIKNTQKNSVSTSQHSMVELKSEDFKFLWSFSLLGLFQSQHPIFCRPIFQLAFVNAKHGGSTPTNEGKPSGLKLYEIVLPMFQLLSSERFFEAGLITMDICKELLQILSYSTYMDNSWNSLAISILSQVAHNCPQEIFNSENFDLMMTELCLDYLFKVFRSANKVSASHPDSEVNLIHTLCSTTKAVINRIETKTHKLSKSVVLSLVLAGYKCIRESSTETSLSEAIDMINCTSPLLKKIIDDEAELDDGTISVGEMFGTCLSVVVALTKDCIEGFHLQEIKNIILRKLIQMKLAFSLEQIVSISKLTLEIKCVEDCEASNTICASALRYCIQCIQSVLNDSNVQVQVIGLQFLKARVQRGANTEDNSFLMFLVGELISDIFTLIQKVLKKNPVTRESVTIASECLSFMVLLQTLSKGDDCQRSFMNLLLEAIVMIFVSIGDASSQEVNDLRNTAIKLVSRLAQIPSSAVHFKDVMLSMPPLHRQQIQGVIRASVTHDKNPMELKGPVLDIKIPKPLVGNEEKHHAPSAAVVHVDESDKEEEEDEDDVSEDDWDAFQSFPVSKNEDGDEPKAEDVAECNDPGVVKSSSDVEGSAGGDEFQERSMELNGDDCVRGDEEMPVQTNPDADKPVDNEHPETDREACDQTSPDANELSGMENQETDKELQHDQINPDAIDPGDNEHPEVDKEMLDQTNPDANEPGDNENQAPQRDQTNHAADKPGDNENQAMDEESQLDQTNHDADKHGDNEHENMEEELQSLSVQEEAISTPGNEQVSSDHKPEVEDEGSTKEDLSADKLQRQVSPEQVASDSSSALQQDSCESDNGEQSNECKEDDKKDSINESKNHEPPLGISESQVDSEQNSAKLEPSTEHREEE